MWQSTFGKAAALLDALAFSWSALDATADGQQAETEQDRFGQAGGHLQVGAGGGEILP